MGARCPAQVSKQYASINSPHLREFNSDMKALENGLDSYGVYVNLLEMPDTAN